MATYYVDAATGSDSNTATQAQSPSTPWATPGKAAAQRVINGAVGDIVWIKSGTYTTTSATANVAGGVVSDPGGASGAANAHWRGYNTATWTGAPTATDLANKPIIRLGAALTGATILKANGNHITFDNIEVDGNSNTTSTGINLANTYGRAIDCRARNCTTRGFDIGDSSFSTGVFAALCEAIGCSGSAGAFAVGGTNLVYGCDSHGNTTHGFGMNGNARAIDCIAWGNTGTADGFNCSSIGYSAINCRAYGNGRYGFDCTGNAGFNTLLANCWAYSNTSGQFKSDGVKDGLQLLYCSDGRDTPANFPNVRGLVTLTGDPSNNATTANDLSLNNTAGAGAALRGAGFPGTFPGGITVGHDDIGGSGHADPAGGGSTTAYRPIVANTWTQIG